MKLDKNTYPDGHDANDFTCFGPVATQDGCFENTMICDMGCFTQDGKDSNKYYHGAVVQSKKDQQWYTYFEWGRTGAIHPTFQFIQCSSKESALEEYCSQLHSKNDKRGVWVDHASLGRILQAKPGKDCYLVRPLAKRTSGLPDARMITQNENAQPAKVVVKQVKKNSRFDPITVKLMRDLNVGTINYTRSAMSDAALPTNNAIEEARKILTEAQKRVVTVGDAIQDQWNDKELQSLTSMIYSRIPKRKDRNAPPEQWLLSAENINSWMLDLDAFEQALFAINTNDESDPFEQISITMQHISSEPKGQFIHNWAPTATRNKHGNMGRLKVLNVWEIQRQDKFDITQKQIIAKRNEALPLHQPKRIDLNDKEIKQAIQSNTALLFHGTRSVNVGGLLRESWKLPNTLVGVKITAWMMGVGVYFADDWKKSAQYSSLAGARYAQGSGGIQNRGAFMFASDVVLGTMYVAPAAKGFTKPPEGYNSVFGKAGHTQGWGGALLNNEFIVYDTNQCRGRYLIEFEA